MDHDRSGVNILWIEQGALIPDFYNIGMIVDLIENVKNLLLNFIINLKVVIRTLKIYLLILFFQVFIFKKEKNKDI